MAMIRKQTDRSVPDIVAPYAGYLESLMAERKKLGDRLTELRKQEQPLLSRLNQLQKLEGAFYRSLNAIANDRVELDDKQRRGELSQ